MAQDFHIWRRAEDRPEGDDAAAAAEAPRPEADSPDATEEQLRQVEARLVGALREASRRRRLEIEEEIRRLQEAARALPEAEAARVAEVRAAVRTLRDIAHASGPSPRQATTPAPRGEPGEPDGAAEMASASGGDAARLSGGEPAPA